jgi:hypothetical protein
MCRHHIHLVKSLVTGRALAHPVAEARVNACLAEDVTTSLDDGVLEVLAADRAQREFLLC